jgi:hypothetical protein
VSPVLLVNCPSTQASHVVSTSAAEAVPIAQNLQATSKVHANAEVSRYFPATQELQKIPAESRTFPVGHSMQAEVLYLIPVTVFPPHAVHSVCARVEAYSPSPQSLHIVLGP